MPAPRHARPSAPRVRFSRSYLTAALAGLAVAAVAVPLAFTAGPAGPALAARPDLTPDADGLHVQEVSPVVVHRLTAGTYTVRPGDTLTGISARVCGTPGDYLALAYNNRLRNPDRVFAHQVLTIACHAAAAALRAAYPPPRPHAPTLVAARTAGSNGTPGSVGSPAGAGDYSCSGLEALWVAAGGSPGAAFTAAEIAMAESGGNPGAVSPTDDLGLWQINASNGALATLSPSGSARSAVILSRDGTNWSPWTTYTDGAYAGRC